MTDLWAAQLTEVEPAPDFRLGNLTEKFIQPPFSVLDTRKGDWQARRRAWLALGIKSELGRGSDLLSLSPAEGARARWEATIINRQSLEATRAPGYKFSERRGDLPVSGSAGEWSRENTPAGEGGTSIFDPVLCELAYRWFCPEGGSILDPFAGGSVRGIVAAKLGHPYTGIDLSREQLAANNRQAGLILAEDEPRPHWITGDSTTLEELLPAGEMYDMVWTCPPYFDLEVYSDDPADLSTMTWPAFCMAYDKVIEQACARLKPGRFAGIVVSEVRQPDGAYRGFVPYTVHAFERAGMRYYNEAVLINAAGSLPLRVTRYMEASRKLGRSHQNILIFAKGEPERGWSYDRAALPDPQLSLFGS